MKTELFIQRVESMYSRGLQSADSRLTRPHIYNKLLTLRKRFLSEKIKSKRKVSEWSYQTLKCIEMEKLSEDDCKCVISCSVLYKSKYKIPKPLIDYSKDSIVSINKSNGEELILQSKDSIQYSSGSKYTSNILKVFIDNEYLYSTKNVGKYISIKMLAEDPYEVEKYNYNCDESESDSNCISPLDIDFKIDPDIEDLIIETAVKELLEIFTRVKQDNTDISNEN